MVVQRVKEVNAHRQSRAPGRKFTGASSDDTILKASPELAVDYIVAPPYIDFLLQYAPPSHHIGCSSIIRYIRRSVKNLHFESIAGIGSGLHRGPAPNGVVYGAQHTDLRRDAFCADVHSDLGEIQVCSNARCRGYTRGFQHIQDDLHGQLPGGKTVSIQVGRRCQPHGENHLPGCYPFAESLWHFRPGAAV